MTTRNQSPLTSVLAVVLVIWLLFMGGLSTIKQWTAAGGPAGIISTLGRGAGRVLATPIGGAGVPRPTAPSVAQPRGDAGNPAQPVDSQAQIPAAADAPAQPVNGSQSVLIVIPTSIPIEQVTVVPLAMPRVYAQSGPVEPTPIPTITYPTQLPAAAAVYGLSPDGKCVTAMRDGVAYQACQGWPYSDAEARSVADYLRTGLLPGVKVE